MDRRLIALAAGLTTLPLPALAQAWPGLAAVSVAGARVLPRQATRTFAVVNDQPAPAASGAISALRMPAPTGRPLKLTVRAALDDNSTPSVDIPAKAAWSDDQGFRLDFTTLNYKRRF